MEQPLGFVAQGEIDRVCRLRKSLYGLKQTLCAWFGKFNEVIEKFGAQKSKTDHSICYRNFQAGIILLVVYVDDIIITGKDMTGISSLKSFLHGQFHTKDLGMLKYFLGVEVMRSKRGIFLSQSHVSPLWHKAYILQEKANCLKTLRDIEGWLGS